MGISIFSNSGQVNYGIKHFIIDNEKDLTKMSTSSKPGSTIFCIENSKFYMLNNQHKWIETQLNNDSSGRNSGSDSAPMPDIEDGDTVVYDGGSPV